MPPPMPAYGAKMAALVYCIAVGTPITGHPRRDPDEYNSRLGLPSWVFNDKPLVWPPVVPEGTNKAASSPSISAANSG